MSHGHNKHKGFSQTSKRFDGSLKEEHQKSRSTQHSAGTVKEESLEEKSPRDSTSVGRKTSQAT